MTSSLAWWGAFVLFALLVILEDLRHRRVSNRLLLLALAFQSLWLLGNLAGWLAPAGSSASALSGGIAMVLSLLVFWPLWRAHLMGAGDIKFLATLGWLTGLENWLIILLLGSIPGALHALTQVMLLRREAVLPVRYAITRRGIPYAGYLAAAALLWSLWWHWGGTT